MRGLYPEITNAKSQYIAESLQRARYSRIAQAPLSG